VNNSLNKAKIACFELNLSKNVSIMPRTIAHNDKRSAKKRKKDFLLKLEETASITRACKLAKVPRRTVYDWIDNDDDFVKDLEKSKLIAVHALEDEAVRRAFEGTLKPIYQGGKLVGKIREYSDTLLVMLMKGGMPDKYKERFAGEMSGPGGGPIHTHVTKDDIDYDNLSTEVLDAILKARKKSDE
jgi:hypothetical protein